MRPSLGATVFNKWANFSSRPVYFCEEEPRPPGSYQTIFICADSIHQVCYIVCWLMPTRDSIIMYGQVIKDLFISMERKSLFRFTDLQRWTAQHKIISFCFLINIMSYTQHWSSRGTRQQQKWAGPIVIQQYGGTNSSLYDQAAKLKTPKK